MPKLLIYGLDGISPDTLRTYANANKKGYFYNFFKRGIFGDLASTLPHFTAPAWLSFATGLNPGGHGVFHWRLPYDPVERKRPLLSTSHLTNATFWALAQSQGLKVSVSNFPMQYPAPPTFGKYICGTLATEDAVDATWPPHLMDEVRKKNPGFRFEMDKGVSYLNKPKELKNHVLEILRAHDEVFLDHLCGPENDLVFHVNTITDRVQHFFWNYHDLGHPLKPLSLGYIGNPVEEVLSSAEARLAEAVSRQKPDDVLILSDHGMGPSYRAFHTDAWLAKHDFLHFRGAKVLVDTSMAYSGEEPECAIFLGPSLRGPRGSVSKKKKILAQIRTLLVALIDPSSGRRVFKNVHFGEAVSSGRFSDMAPDLLLLPEEGFHPRPGYSKTVFSDSTRLVAGHRYLGMFGALGSHFRKGTIPEDLAIVDLFPAVCVCLGLEIPGGLDSNYLRAAALVGLKKVPPIKEGNWARRVTSPPMKRAQSVSVEARLKELGYLE